METEIKVKGARTHNLKDISVTVPRNKLTVFTGLSGSGKSSLAFDTIYAEGHRRFVESLSSYARQFLGQLDKPDVDFIEGLSPAIAIDQKTTSKNPRSTVGTVTEIYDYMRLLYARLGVPHCPVCGIPIKQQTIDEIGSRVLTLEDGTRFMVLSPVVAGKKGMHDKVLDDARKGGFVRAYVDGEMYDLSEVPALDKNLKHDIDIVVDRLVMRSDGIVSRLTDSIETASNLSNGIIKILLADSGEVIRFSQNYACPEHGISLGELEPRLFSFNSPVGACEDCSGIGMNYVVSPDRLIPDKSMSLFSGAVICNGFKSFEPGSYTHELFNSVGKHYGWDVHTPIQDMTEDGLHVLLYGNKYARRSYSIPKFEGIVNMVKRRYDSNTSPESREYYEAFMDNVPCPSCNGRRLRPEALAVTVGDKNISELCDMSVSVLREFFRNITFTESERAVAKEILKEIDSRLGFLENVGLEYLTLSRAAGSLSGGEAQRIRLATQVGSALVGVMYVLDEPSIGLHQRDNIKLINTLKSLRDLGNTVLVVEHDEETMLSADHIVDIGPYAGVRGGEVLFSGTPKELLEAEGSITAEYLSGRRVIPVPKARRQGNGLYLTVKGAKQNNLKNIDVAFPLGKLICVTGVSGSGKSSLVNSVLCEGAARALGRLSANPGKCDCLEGLENIDKVIQIDQSPIGRTPRSNPATYTGMFTDIRSLYASTPDAKARGYKEGRFSFNIKGGRCEACEGDGTIKIEMHFLPDVYVKCDVCKGRRYNRETLEVKYKGKSIYDVLEMTVDEGMEFFANYQSIFRRLKTLHEVGLGYIKIGQSSTTLSGGEAQRVKLATELARRGTGKTLYILDEPTTGLHSYDVDKLNDVLHRLVDAGNTVVVIEHNLDLIKTADYIIDLGPEGGDGGGTIVTCGTPEQVADCKESYTGQFLRKVLG